MLPTSSCTPSAYTMVVLAPHNNQDQDQRKRVNPLEFLQNMWQMLCGFIDVIYINSLNLCKKGPNLHKAGKINAKKRPMVMVWKAKMWQKRQW